MRKQLLCFFILLNAIQLFSQDFEDYQALRNQGLLPTDFTVLPSVKYAKDLKKINAHAKRKSKLAQKDFY